MYCSDCADCLSCKRQAHRTSGRIECNDFHRFKKIRMIDPVRIQPPRWRSEWLEHNMLMNAVRDNAITIDHIPPFTMEMAVDEPVRYEVDPADLFGIGRGWQQ